MASFEDYYEILQVSPSAEPEVIEAAYKKLAQKYHPDVNKSPTAAEKMKKINIAHDVLGDPVQRKRYHAEWLQRKGEKTSYTGTNAPPEPKPSSKSQPRHQQRDPTPKPSPITKEPSRKRRKIAAYIISGLVVLIIIPIIFINTIFSTQSKIAIVSDRDGNSEIYIIDVDGDNLTRLTNNTGAHTEPAWSPDSKKIAFHSDRDGGSDIYTINADGKNLRKITNTNNSEVNGPVWSPDGKKIAFILTQKISPPYVMTLSLGDTFTTEWVSDIIIINTDGSNQIQVTNNYPYQDYSHYPYSTHEFAWSPDGKKIAFVLDVDFNKSNIYVVNANGSGQQRLTSSSGWDSEPKWSPDGKKLIFSSDRDEFLSRAIYIMDLDGGNQTRLTDVFGLKGYTIVSYSPEWSPDGNKIAFLSDRDFYHWGLYTMDVDGSNQIRLAPNLAMQDLAWSPDATRIASVSADQDNYGDLYVINADGKNLIKITSQPMWNNIRYEGNHMLMWSPR